MISSALRSGAGQQRDEASYGPVLELATSRPQVQRRTVIASRTALVTANSIHWRRDARIRTSAGETLASANRAMPTPAPVARSQRRRSRRPSGSRCCRPRTRCGPRDPAQLRSAQEPVTYGGPRAAGRRGAGRAGCSATTTTAPEMRAVARRRTPGTTPRLHRPPCPRGCGDRQPIGARVVRRPHAERVGPEDRPIPMRAATASRRQWPRQRASPLGTGSAPMRGTPLRGRSSGGQHAGSLRGGDTRSGAPVRRGIETRSPDDGA